MGPRFIEVQQSRASRGGGYRAGSAGYVPADIVVSRAERERYPAARLNAEGEGGEQFTPARLSTFR
jgi:hypothetical protein